MMLMMPIIEVQEENATPTFGLEQLFWLGRSPCSEVGPFLDAAVSSSKPLVCDQNHLTNATSAWVYYY